MAAESQLLAVRILGPVQRPRLPRPRNDDRELRQRELCDLHFVFKGRKEIR